MTSPPATPSALERLTTMPAHLRNAGLGRRRSQLPWGGDKIAFEPVAAVPAELREQAAKATKIIEDAREQKRAAKAEIEKEKERTLKDIRRIAKVLDDAGLRPAKTIKNPKDIKSKQLEVKVAITLKKINLKKEDGDLAVNLVILDDEGVTKMNKDVLHEFHDKLGKTGWDFLALTSKFAAAGLRVTKVGDGHEITAKGPAGEVPIYRVSWGEDRVATKPGESGVYQQRGYKDKPAAESRRKEYVLDENGVVTRRFVTRAINFRHLAAMMGLKVDFHTGAVTVSNTAGQEPRGSGERFDRNAETFDLNSGAVTEPGRWDQRYQATGDTSRMPESGAAVSDVRARENLGPESRMNINERASMQVRNGSSAVAQTMLSTASVQEPMPGQEQKVIRGNKGERFDNTADSMAVLELDLAKAERRGIKFVNQHSNDSNEYKIAYDRFKSATDKEIKRKAKEELDEYIYSGRKNREVTIERIPNSLITRIKLTGGRDKWPGIQLDVDTWLPWDEKTRNEIAVWVTPERLERIHRKVKRAEAADKLGAGVKR